MISLGSISGSLAGPELGKDEGIKCGKVAVSHWLSSDCSGSIAVEAVVWFPRIVTTELWSEFYFYIWSDHWLSLSLNSPQRLLWETSSCFGPCFSIIDYMSGTECGSKDIVPFETLPMRTCSWNNMGFVDHTVTGWSHEERALECTAKPFCLHSGFEGRCIIWNNKFLNI